MAIDASVLRAMQAAGASIDIIIAAVEAEAALDEARRASKRANNAERQRRFKARRKGEETQDNAGNALLPVTSLDKKVSPQTPLQKINPSCPPLSPQTESFPDRFVTAWNAAADRDGLTKAIPLNAERRAKLKRRVSEFGEQSLLDAIGKLAGSPFHCGENDRNWRADIGWLLRSAENVTKALEITAPKSTGPPVDGFLAHVLQRQHRNETQEQPA